MTYVPFARQSVGDEYRAFSDERLLNWYAQPWPDGASGEVMLAPCPGLTQRAEPGGGRIKQLLSLGPFVYGVSGNRCFRMQSAPASTITDLGFIASDSFVTIATTGTDVAFASNGNLRVWQTDTNTFSNPTLGVFTDVGSVCAADGFFIISEQVGKRFAYSALNNATSWDALDFFTAESAPDQIVVAKSAFQEIWIFGEDSTEVWSVVGGASVLARNPGGIIPVGCFWGGTATTMSDSIIWVGDDKRVYRARGYSPQRVSTEAVERHLANYDRNADVQAFRYVWRGHEFYVLWTRDAPAWCLDLNTGLWHERSTGVGREDPFLGRCAAPARDNFLDGTADEWVIGTEDGTLCNLGGLTDAGATIAREAQSVILNQGEADIAISELTAHFRTGDTDIGRDVQVMMQTRRKKTNKWRTWGPERWRSLGDAGEDVTARWHNLGNAKAWQFRLRVTDPVDTALYGVTYAQ